MFRVWGFRAFVRDTSADKLSARAIPCVFLGFVPDAPSWQFYHPTSGRVLPSQDVTFDESVPLYRLFPYRSALLPPPPLFLAPGPPPVDPLPPRGLAPLGVSQENPPPGIVPGEVAVDSGAARGTVSGGAEPGGSDPGVGEPRGAETEGAEPGGGRTRDFEPWGAETRGAEPGGAETGGAELGGAEPEDVEPGGAESEGAEPGGAEPQGAALSGAIGAGGAGAGGAGVTVGAGVTRGTTTTGPRGARTRGTGASGTSGVGGAGARDPAESGAAGAGGSSAGGARAGGAGVGGARVGGAGVGGAGVGGTGAVGAGAADPGSAVRPRPRPLCCLLLLLTERREHASRPVSLVRTARCVPCSRPPPVPGMHAMALRPSSVPLRVALPAPPESSLLEVPYPESDRAHATSPTISRLLATAVFDPSFESAAASALVAELLDFAAACRLDHATALVSEFESANPPSVGGECALGTDVLEDKQEDFECLAAAVPRFPSMLLAPEGDPDAPDIPTPCSYAEAITGPYSSQWQAVMDAEMASWKSTGTYVIAAPPQRQGVDSFQTFSPTLKMTTLWVLLHVAAQHDFELHSLDFSTAFMQGSQHKEIWLHRPPGFTESFPASTQWSLRRPVYDLRQAPREWHDTLRTTLATLGFAPSIADPSLFLRIDTSLPLFYVLVYLGLQITRNRARHTITLTQSLMVHQVLQRFGFQFSPPQPTPLSTSHWLLAPPSDESVEPSVPYLELVGCLITSGMGLVLGGRGLLVLTGYADASWVDDPAKQWSSQGYTFSLGSGYVSWQSTRSSSVLSSSCEAEIYAGAMAAQELCWLTYLLTDLGEQPRSPPVLYVDNKAMIALCQEHRLEHRTKHITLRHFFAQELQQRGQLRLAYVATRANTADIFTKALLPGDHQCFSPVLGLVPTLPHLLTA
ncbi:unnamed protein product [Closterium sp. NIES-54]